MKRLFLLGAALALAAADAPPQPSPSEIVEAAKAEEWVAIAPVDLLAMELPAPIAAIPSS